MTAESSVQGARRAAGQEFQNRINTEVGQWTVPTIGELKCNVDAAIFKDVNMFSVGMCIRDDKEDLSVHKPFGVLPNRVLKKQKHGV